jgi:pyruvate,water dikinase
MAQPKYIRRFDELGIDDVPLVGGKNASLGEMYRSLAASGVKVPNGFAVTADAYRYFLESNALTGRIQAALDALDVSDVTQLAATGAQVRSWVREATLPADLIEEIRAGYEALAVEYGPEPDVAVRSSATAEDLPDASFAGQQETYLNVRGLDPLLKRCRDVFASLFTDRAISYREDKGFDHAGVALSIGVQKMVRSDLACSGVMFTLDTESGFRDVVFITSAYGLGENVVQGAVNPDEFYVFKPTLAGGFRPLIKRQRGEKAVRMVYAEGPAAERPVVNLPVPEEDRLRFSLSDDEVLQLARHAVAIEEHYSARAGVPRPMDIEWAKDGVSGEIYIVQARPETVHAVRGGVVEETYALKERGPVLAKGKSVGHKIASGRARVILSASRMKELRPGEVLVTDMTDPDWEPVMKIASAIVTNRGGRTCHAAIVARELGIPAVVGAGDATATVGDGQDVTISCAEGDVGLIYAGKLAFEIERIDYSKLPRPRTRIMLNVGNPDLAFAASALPNEGVGLARLEFIINSSIRVHPRALLELDRLSPALQEQIRAIIAGYPTPREFYIQRLAEGVATIAAAFHPKPIIVRMSDFKSNEYAALIGGEAYEPHEENPMIGFRGASRYPSESFADCFALECAAMRRVREDMGLTNVELMLPFVRTPEEGRRVLGLMAEHGLRRGENGLKVKLMCEIPANVVLADEFLQAFDGFSIGSNDLTQLTLGIDRDSGLLTGYDERNPAVLRMMQMAIEACRRHGKYVGICGQAPSDFPEITTWLVEQGIESMSLNPDSVLAMTRTVLDVEARLALRVDPGA